MTATASGPAPHLLEQWYRDTLVPGNLDISSSGVHPYTLGELMELVGLDVATLSGLLLGDSTALGYEPLRQAIAERHGVAEPDSVMVTHGSSEALDLGLRAILRPGDEVVVVRPAYHALLSVPKTLGCDIRWWRLHRADRFQVRIDDLRSLVRPTTRAVILNFPHNPTGLTLTRAELAEVVAITARVGAYLVWDGAFTDLVFDRDRLPEPAGLAERVLSTGTLSKAFGAPGLRCGWLIAPRDVLAVCVALRDRGNLFLSPIVETVADAVIRHADLVIGKRLAEAATNRAILRRFLAEASWVRAFTGEAGVTMFARHARAADTVDWSRRIAAAGVVVVPGRAFGEPEWLRFGFGGPTGELVAALQQLDQAVSVEKGFP